jgi:hypothetical protein
MPGARYLLGVAILDDCFISTGLPESELFGTSAARSRGQPRGVLDGASGRIAALVPYLF